MKRNKGAKATRETLQVWSLNQARSAIPYLTSVIRSMRDFALQSKSCRHRVVCLARQHGRPTRANLIALQEAERDAREAETRYLDASADLEALDVFTLDPIRGQALIPFVHEEQLAWFVFDLFEPKPLRFWRFQADPDDTRRPITPTQQGWTGTTEIV